MTMNFARKIKIFLVFSFVFVTAFLATIGITPWIAEPRKYIQEDEFLMSITPFTKCLISATALILWIPVLKYGYNLILFFHKLDKKLKKNSDGKSNNV